MDAKKLAVMWLHFKADGLLDVNYVKIAHASSISELVKIEEDMSADREVQFELAQWKAELAIASKYYMQVGHDSFSSVFPNPMMGPSFPPLVIPEWALDMKKELESVGHRPDLIQYLSANVPCNCLAKLSQTIQQEDPMPDNRNCSHGVDSTNADHLTDEWKQNAKNKLVRYAFVNKIANNANNNNCNNMGAGTWRDWKPMKEFFQEYPSFACQEFAVLAYASATKFYLQKRDSDTSEQICNLALLAELCASHGYENVMKAMEHAEDSQSRTMEPFLRTFYIDAKKTTALSSLLRTLQKKTPCSCIDDSRAIIHAEGSARNELCNVCFLAVPKNKFLACSRCGIEEYCSKKCSEMDHPKHKHMCKLLASVAPDGKENN
ncbi:MAG: hypothetical protein SGILL_009563 [Bacillariaceae sp.]